jgi:hypothetical protein
MTNRKLVTHNNSMWSYKFTYFEASDFGRNSFHHLLANQTIGTNRTWGITIILDPTCYNRMT